uniref:Uncharacterized protein n=1 Tax=Methylophaga nitratireducenticrescens TaxID=754476 RepID=I1XF84_METNJ
MTRLPVTGHFDGMLAIQLAVPIIGWVQLGQISTLKSNFIRHEIFRYIYFR